MRRRKPKVLRSPNLGKPSSCIFEAQSQTPNVETIMNTELDDVTSHKYIHFTSMALLRRKHHQRSKRGTLNC